MEGGKEGSKPDPGMGQAQRMRSPRLLRWATENGGFPCGSAPTGMACVGPQRTDEGHRVFEGEGSVRVCKIDLESAWLGSNVPVL